MPLDFPEKFAEEIETRYGKDNIKADASIFSSHPEIPRGYDIYVIHLKYIEEDGLALIKKLKQVQPKSRLIGLCFDASMARKDVRDEMHETVINEDLLNKISDLLKETPDLAA